MESSSLLALLPLLFRNTLGGLKDTITGAKKDTWKRNKGKQGRGATGSIIRTSHVASRRYQNIHPRF